MREKYAIDRILRERDRLADVLHAEAADEPIVGDRFRRVVQVAFETLPAGVDYETLWDSLRIISGVCPTKAQLRDVAHRLVGNVHNLKNRRVVVPWTFQRDHEWCPLAVTRVRRTKSPSGKFGVTLTFKVMAGTPCPMLIEKFWSLKYCSFMSQHFGFSRPPSLKAKYPPRFPYIAPEEFVTLRLYGLMDPKLSGSEPAFDKVRFPGSVLAYNREQLRHRVRGTGYECPRDFPLTVRCYQCPVGYEECRGACHAKTYVTQECPLCKQRSPFDPEQQSPYCVNCVARAAYAKE